MAPTYVFHTVFHVRHLASYVTQGPQRRLLTAVGRNRHDQAGVVSGIGTAFHRGRGLHHIPQNYKPRRCSRGSRAPLFGPSSSACSGKRCRPAASTRCSRFLASLCSTSFYSGGLLRLPLRLDEIFGGRRRGFSWWAVVVALWSRNFTTSPRPRTRRSCAALSTGRPASTTSGYVMLAPTGCGAQNPWSRRHRGGACHRPLYSPIW